MQIIQLRLERTVVTLTECPLHCRVEVALGVLAASSSVVVEPEPAVERVEQPLRSLYRVVPAVPREFVTLHQSSLNGHLLFAHECFCCANQDAPWWALTRKPYSFAHCI